MTTKVKGEAIKEGSIPFSALATEVKDKIENAGGGADWNAQEDEPGYIENKPFGYFDFKEVEWYLSEDENYHYCTEISNQIKFNGIVYDIFDNEVTNIDGAGGVIVSTQGISAYGFSQDTLKSVLVKIEYKIDEKYLPDTYIKTTPQTLSDTDKNQALANLGIDPVVLKYLLNPLPVDMNTVIPEELLVDIAEGWFWKYPVTNIITGTWNDGKYKHAAISTNVTNPEVNEGGVYIEDVGYCVIDYETRTPVYI